MKNLILKITAIAGFILLIAGLLIYGLYPLIIGGPVTSVLGFLMILPYVILNWKELKASVSVRSAKYGTNTLIFVLLVLAIVTLLNVLAHVYRLRTDTTLSKMNSLSQQTIDVLSKLPKTLRIYGFIPPKDGNARDAFISLCDLYSYHSGGKVTCSIEDPDRNPGLARKFLVSTNAVQVYGFETDDNASRVEFLGEEDFTSAIIKVLRKHSKSIYFTIGHAEGAIGLDKELGYLKLAAKLENLGYTVQSLNLLNYDNIPNNCSLLIINSPKTSFMQPELDRINKYIANGGSLLIFDDPLTTNNIADISGIYGLIPDDDVVIDVQSYLQDPFVPVVHRYANHSITRDERGTIPETFFNLSRSISTFREMPKNTEATPLASTSLSNSYGEKNIKRYIEKNRAQFNNGEDLMGPLTVAYAATKSFPPLTSPSDPNYNPLKDDVVSKMVIFGDSDFVSNKYIDFYGNSILVLNAINWLAGDLDLISISRPATKPNIIMLDEVTKNLIYYIILILFPGIMVFTGMFIWWKKRKT